IQGGGIFFDPHTRGPNQLPSNVDYQELSSYLEYAFNKRLSAFVEIPYRFVHFGQDLEEDAERRGLNGKFAEPEGGAIDRGGAPFDTRGLADIQAGFKAALIADPNRYLTFQLCTYIPTGDARQGLGTGHVTLEPGLLLYERLTDRLVFQGQFK